MPVAAATATRGARWVRYTTTQRAAMSSVADLAVFGQLHAASSGAVPETQRALFERARLVEYLKRVEQATGG